MSENPLIDKGLIRQYQLSGPRYTSYPSAVHFHEGFNDEHYADIAKHTNEDLVPSPLSLYFHLPFCRNVCFYCACSKIITNNKARAAPYLDDLHNEIVLKGKLFDRDRIVEQLHWGGGTPTFIDHTQMRNLMKITRENFSLRNDDLGDYSVELDPREIDEDTIPVLRETGFNRISIGVQDFNPEVQKQVNRIQTIKETAAAVNLARLSGFRSINIDLIYGLPAQTVESFLETLKIIVAINPDRIAVYNYAHLPHLFKTQRQINEELLPSAEVKFEMLQQFTTFLIEHGYIYIGMDHFARPDDELALAQQTGTLHRNFQGYSTRAGCDLIGFGMTAISSIGTCYAQNARTLEEYENRVREKRIPVIRGIKLDDDDVLRRDVINRLICNFHIDYSDIEDSHGIDFGDYFYDELILLGKMKNQGLLDINFESITVLPKGRFLIRNVCMIFDKYMHPGHFKGTYSQVI